MGYDLYISFYHQTLDLLEKFRFPVVDRLVLNLTNLRALRACDLILNEKRGGLHLESKTLREVFRPYEIHQNREFIEKTIASPPCCARRSVGRPNGWPSI